LERAWLWRDQLQPVAELDGAGNVVARFVYAEGANVPELVVTSTATYRLVKDRLGSVRSVVDVGTGIVVQTLEYDAWGRVLTDSSPGLQPFGFAGGIHDVDTGLSRFGARDLDADLGRWTARDPSRFNQLDGPNLYAYVANDPVNALDPYGLMGDSSGGSGAAADGAPPSDLDDFCTDCEPDPLHQWLMAILAGPLGCGPAPPPCPSADNDARCDGGYSKCMDSKETWCCEESLAKCKACDSQAEFRCERLVR